MKRLFPLLLLIPLTLSCNAIVRQLSFGVTPPPLPTRPPAPTESGAIPISPTLPPRATATPFVLALEKIATPPTECSESPLGLDGDKIVEVAYVPSGFCFNGELDLFETGGHLYVAQSLAFNAAFFITDVTDPANPAIAGMWQWNEYTYTADVKAFKQGERRFLSLSLEPSPSNLCGVAIVEVTDPANPILIGRYEGKNTGSSSAWCDTHTTQISRDENGDGAYIYASAVNTGDLRVLDIRDLTHVYEVGHYSHPLRSESTFVHDTTIVGDRVYVAYWAAGLVILDRGQLESGAEVKPLNPPNSIDPDGLEIHQAYPTADGNFVFVEDEVNYDGETSQLRMYDIRDLSEPKEVLQVALDGPFSSPHNMLVDGDLLYVGWYTDGVRVFKYDVSDPNAPTVEPYAFKAVRSKKTEGVFGSDIYDGVWGVRLHACEVGGQKTTCVYASDLTRGLVILAFEP
ncbi:MAG: hypothetical protein HYZ49_09475 [Chloroflexi bacterium]|nr:hypothetical protein [Chloroflexota bacterium]